MLFKKQNLISQAISAGERAIEISPFDAESHFNYGNTLKLAGRIDDAITSLAQALILSPDFYDAQRNLGIALSGHRFIEPNAKLYPVFLNLLLTKYKMIFLLFSIKNSIIYLLYFLIRKI